MLAGHAKVPLMPASNSHFEGGLKGYRLIVRQLQNELPWRWDIDCHLQIYWSVYGNLTVDILHWWGW